MTLPHCADAAGLSKDLCFACEFGTELLTLLRPRETAAYNLLLISDFIFRRSISDRAMPIGKAKPKFFNRAPHSAQRAEGDRDRRTALRRLRSRSGGLWGFLRGCKGGDPEPLPRPLKGPFPFRERGFLHAKHLRQFYTISVTYLPRIPITRSIAPPLLQYITRSASIRSAPTWQASYFSPKRSNSCSFSAYFLF